MYSMYVIIYPATGILFQMLATK